MQGLVADANPVTQRVLANLLIYCGHSASAFACDAETAWRSTQDMQPDFVLVDWEIISANDFALLRQAESSGLLARIPFLVMVPGLDPNLMAEAAIHGARDYLPKPIPAHLLSEKIEEATTLAREMHTGNTSSEGASRTAGSSEKPTARQAREHYAKGREFLLARDLKQAAEYFHTALSAVTRFPEAHKGLAICLRGMGNPAQAVSHLEQAAECYIQTDRPDKAVSLFRESSRLKLAMRNPFLLLGERYRAQGELDRAIPLLEQARQLTPKEEECIQTLAGTLMDAGEDTRALVLVRPWLELDPPPLWAMAIETALNEQPVEATPDMVFTVCAGEEPGSGEPPSILIVDDEPHIRLLLEQSLEILEDDDVTLLFAEDGQKGLDMIRSHRPDLVFLDVMMPAMNGFEVCETVKREEDAPYVIMLTAKGQEFDRKRGMEAGADVYMTKPFRPVEVLNLARAVLDMD